METGLRGKVVLVTGGAGGIGQAICRQFAEEGAKVAIHYHTSSEGAEELATEIGGMAIHADLRVPSQADEMVDTVVSQMGSLDICVANSGIYPPDPRPMWEIDEERWNSTILSNLGVTANTSRSFLSHVSERGSGSLVLVGSTAGIYGEAGHSDYAAAKGAITTGLLLSLKNEVSRLGSVRVNAVAPGWTLTEKKVESGLDEEVMQRAKSTMALKKLATPNDVARAIVILSSDEVSGHITGQVIEVAGGMEGRLV
ncbi:MAG TPA: SDR family oxidoreductase [Candidatus Poseidoniales archaeon]|nr:MAG: oxidoreductase [Euryarchaeota archaeon]HIG34395.1 SDR family oxidoreductase [Candidatus Poseidoniales archaeon]HIL67603.1 SDR family oxidoreductase [Candidatus Poseidoniales archaeon]